MFLQQRTEFANIFRPTKYKFFIRREYESDLFARTILGGNNG